MVEAIAYTHMPFAGAQHLYTILCVYCYIKVVLIVAVLTHFLHWFNTSRTGCHHLHTRMDVSTPDNTLFCILCLRPAHLKHSIHAIGDTCNSLVNQTRKRWLGAVTQQSDQSLIHCCIARQCKSRSREQGPAMQDTYTYALGDCISDAVSMHALHPNAHHTCFHVQILNVVRTYISTFRFSTTSC